MNTGQAKIHTAVQKLYPGGPSGRLNNAEPIWAVATSPSPPQSSAQTHSPASNALCRSTVINNQRVLREALRNEEFFLVYQPKIDLASGRMVGLEALIRWEHPEHGMVLPDRFIPVAEACGVIEEIGAWVIWQSCAQLRQWNIDEGRRWTISVNVSPLELNDAFCRMVTSAMAAHRVEPGRLCLEITESVAMQDESQCEAILRELTRSGVQLSLDDFGKGYSGIGRLKSLSFDEVKLDRSLLQGADADPQSVRLLRAIVQLAHCFGAMVVAEGIQSESVIPVLLEAGCQLGQGNHFSHPMLAHEVPAFARHLSRDSACGGLSGRVGAVSRLD